MASGAHTRFSPASQCPETTSPCVNSSPSATLRPCSGLIDNRYGWANPKWNRNFRTGALQFHTGPSFWSQPVLAQLQLAAPWASPGINFKTSHHQAPGRPGIAHCFIHSTGPKSTRFQRCYHTKRGDPTGRDTERALTLGIQKIRVVHVIALLNLIPPHVAKPIFASSSYLASTGLHTSDFMFRIYTDIVL